MNNEKDKKKMESVIRGKVHKQESVSLQELINNQAMQAQVDRLKEAALEHSKHYMEPESLSDLRKKSTDELLDEYNDYMSLYDTFKDDHYKQRAEMVMAIIKSNHKAS
ncbi:hypothetical protein P59_225 [Bacillus phage P59]|nr:hypothetical protein P59_225 [Bacillus phage P59]